MKKIAAALLVLFAATFGVAQSDSNPSNFAVNVPQKVPVLTSLSPNSAPMGGAPVTMTVTGSNFDPAAQCVWNGSIILTTTFTSSTALKCIVQTALLTVPAGQTSASYPVIVRNPVTTATVGLTWQDLVNPVATTTYNVRRDGALLNSNPLALRSYDDVGVPSGTHSWGITAVVGGRESSPATVSLTL